MRRSLEDRLERRVGRRNPPFVGGIIAVAAIRLRNTRITAGGTSSMGTIAAPNSRPSVMMKF
jgi:hypothetical protein